MKLTELFKKVQIPFKSNDIAQDVDVADIVYDSRMVKKGDLYIAVPGFKVHGDSFINEAIQSGAVAVISENQQPQLSVPAFQVDNARALTGALGRALWNVDLESIYTIGVTGTNGKTTTVLLFSALMDQLHTVLNSWMFGTVEFKIGDKRFEATHTTPEALDIFRFVGKENKQPKSISMEVSSHSLALHRVSGLKYNLAVWTNLTQDHLDFHGSMEEYYRAKKLLFTDYLKNDGVCVINIDDKWGRRLSEELGNKKCITFGTSDDASVKINDCTSDWNGCEIELICGGVLKKYKSSLKGQFNVYNVAAMAAGAEALSVDCQVVQRALDSISTVPGRMDAVDIDAPFLVIVDYAHTPDALENVLKTSRRLAKNRLLTVFGCGGDRDKTKRPLMARAVIDNCDEAIVTSDNPRSEKPQSIINDIVNAIPLDFPHVVIENRREAIACALRNAREGDCIVIAGKGHEEYQEVKGVKHHFSDKETVKELYTEMEKK
ncbi:UDP-N-acetylmuramoyl-L-alanyl-D-glutamate--2,6-diaminopimelate ligase [Chitinispirillales bacterium ANBcel5]|uniref:UDP-N-acetylmuramoyl-L-alanyl-D-glutamate--2, 6-diaminopimelate ligase n=1 Tax=Cellulosispirillum alkaliphilum TaxID=3039283 RepID=UPI002A4EE1AA|nr:UDP-N-acetylmuramoyl-L-alanyl-D-glutamate--2,6-diaminopimelate ligase [Chitinispirillales bacterium ANBcel5]